MTNHAKKTVVIFDLGNVVLDWNVERILASLKASQAEVELLRDELFGHQYWIDLDHGKIQEAAVIAEISTTTPLSSTLVENALRSAKESLSPFPQTLQLMRDIHDHGLALFCLSNMSVETYDHIRHADFFDLFNGIVISGIEGCMKPQEEIFQLLMKRFEFEPTSALFIDDSLPNIDKALELGISSVHFKGSENCYSEIRKRLL